MKVIACETVCVVKHDEAKEVFKAFCDDRRVKSPQISADDADHDVIVAHFDTREDVEAVVLEMGTKFPGKLHWR